MEPGLELVGGVFALIGDPFPLVGSALALVGHPVAFVGATIALIELAAPSLQSERLHTGALGTVTSPLDDFTLRRGLPASTGLLAPLSVLLSQTSAPLEHLGRPHEKFEQAR